MTNTAHDPVGWRVVPTVIVHTRGDVTSEERAYAERAVDDALGLSPVPVWFASVDLRREPGWTRPALARVTVQDGGHARRVHADSFTLTEAVDILCLRLRRLSTASRRLSLARRNPTATQSTASSTLEVAAAVA